VVGAARDSGIAATALTLAGVRTAYNRSADAWTGGPEAVYDRLAEVLLASSPVPLEGARVLDVGAGTGAASRAALGAGARSVVAVDVAAGRPAPPSPFSEDFLPQRLPKRGRRNSRLETPWIRERPVAPEPPVATPAPARPVADASVPARDGVDESAAAPAPAPAATGVDASQPDPAPAASARGGERFAFFAAFRAAAEQAREEAGIDDRRRH